MTTGKRQIPINNHTPGAGAKSAAGAAGAAHGAAQAAAGNRAQQQERDLPVDGLSVLGAERDAPAAERDTLAAERDTLADALLRLRAEFDNFRKRAARELVEARVRAQGELLADLLPVLDNLERALDAAEHHEEGKVLGGVRLTRDMFVDLLARIGVEEIEGVGSPFDPQIHEAMLVQPSEHNEGTVAAVLERGYRQGERVLRPARVSVSSGRAGGVTGAGSTVAADRPGTAKPGSHMAAG
jgi:molecular chaperone GrpE